MLKALQMIRIKIVSQALSVKTWLTKKDRIQDKR